MALESGQIMTHKSKQKTITTTIFVSKLFLISLLLGFHFSTQVASTQQRTQPKTKKASALKKTINNNNKIEHSKPSTPAIQTTPLNDSSVTKKELVFPETINYEKRLAMHESERQIRDIHVTGNVMISKESITNRSPLKIGDKFNVNFTASIIKNLYSLGHFNQIKVYGQAIDKDKIDLFINVEEKPRVKDILFVGNKLASEKELKEAIKADKILTLAKEELKALTVKIKKAYRKKNHHHVTITAKIIAEDDGRVSAEFTIKEGKKSYLNHLSFKGNKQIPSKKLKRIIFSKEDWILGMLDNSGMYNPEMIEGDRYMIEEIYKNNGFIHAKVTDTQVEHDKKTGNYHITYSIQEGDRYRIKSVTTKGNDKVSEDRLKFATQIQEGQIYSLEDLRTALENMRMVWGEYGYIFADIEPSIDIDEETKTVALTFNSDLKDQVYLNRLTIRGNKKTKDKVIRRLIALDEGDMITNVKMDWSKSSVNMLNYFEPKNGVNWKTIRIDDTHADLDLVLNEIKTGHFNTNLSFGGAPTKSQSPQTGLNLGCQFGDRNFIGSGIAINSAIDLSKNNRSISAELSNSWLFDRPIYGAIGGFARSSEYDDEIAIAEIPPYQRTIGGKVELGYNSKYFGGIKLNGMINLESIQFIKKVEAAKRFGANDATIAQMILDKQFQTGNQVALISSLSKDKRNGIGFTSSGHRWNWSNQLTVPGWHPSVHKDSSGAILRVASFNFFKSDFDASWYTPLINEHDLVLAVHGQLGFIVPFRNKDIPWKDLYHIGGPDTIRGYTYGQVGPTWKNDSIGATKAFSLNVEFIMPLTSDLGTRAVIFYDGGAGWDTPYRELFSNTAKADGLSFESDFSNNKFFYRHSVGIGIRLKSPTPLQVDFGIKLNPSKKFRKELTQMHLNMEHAF